MTTISRPRNNLRRVLMTLGVVIWLAGCSRADGKNVQDSHMTQSKMTLWQAIDALAQQVPFSKAKVEHALSTRLTETDEEGNDVFQFFKSTPVTLTDGVVIKNVDLRVKRQGAHPGFMVLELGGQCVGLDAVRGRYSHLEITDVPRGRSLDEATTHSAQLPWGQLSFGFEERNPACLASVSFKPKKQN
ncbi:hypothetical protein [Burkholderia ubonensis]|uniref:hypothetical protein n=1 Tax=Burkholderia ubonensis TaxID=101571 RepID=UPI00210AE367|nr:hypothetical protein [Burkholderia ubonensis]